MKRMVSTQGDDELLAMKEPEPVVKKDRKMLVSALRSGTVIDHLLGGTALRTLHLLQLDQEATVLVGVNLPSSKNEFKDLIKVEGRELTQAEINVVSLISPQATLSIIREFKVVRKFSAQVPDEIQGLIRCVNPACVSQDPRVITRFHTERREPLKLRCYFCERSFRRGEVDFF